MFKEQLSHQSLSGGQFYMAAILASDHGATLQIAFSCSHCGCACKSSDGLQVHQSFHTGAVMVDQVIWVTAQLHFLQHKNKN